MDFYEVIEKRRTIRLFTKGATEEQLRRILLAGSKAPSSGGRQPWEFILIDDREIVQRLAEIKYRLNRKFVPQPGETQDWVEMRAMNQLRGFRNASVIAVCTTTGLARNGWLTVEAMSLAAVAEGLGSNIISYWDDARKEVEELLGIPAGYELTCVLKVGVPAEAGAPRNWRPEPSWLHRNKF